ncbi:MAG: site-specific integrase, partial [Planctomycetes bacterium]|nr:site-specific integrase [Planctomycetota bacterium]
MTPLPSLAMIPATDRGRPRRRERRETPMGLYRQQRSPFWWASFPGPDGKRAWESTGFTAKRAAAEWLDRKKVEVMRKRAEMEDRRIAGLPPEPLRRDSFADFVERDYAPWMRQSLRSADREAYKLRVLVRHFGKLMLDEINGARIHAFVAERGKEHKPATINREIARLRRVLKHAKALGLLPRLPLDEWPHLQERNRRLLALTVADYHRLATVAHEPMRAAIIVAANTGMRRGELCKLTWADVDLSTALARVRDPKNGCPREVPLNRLALDVLRSLPRGLEDPHLFLAPVSGKPWKLERKLWLLTLRRAGLEEIKPRVRFHDLRACFCSWMLEAGIGWHVTASISGHKGGCSAFDRYVTIGAATKRAAVATLADRIAEAGPDAGKCDTGVIRAEKRPTAAGRA